MRGEFDLQAQAFQPESFGFEVFTVDRESEMVHRRRLRSDRHSPREQGEDLCMSCVPWCNPIEDGVLEFAQRFEAENLFIKAAHQGQVVDPQRNFSQAFHLC